MQFWTIFGTALSGVVWPKLSPHHTSFLQSHMRCGVQGVVWSVLSWYIFQDVKANSSVGSTSMWEEGNMHSMYIVFSLVKGVHGAIQCSFGLFLVLHFPVWFGQNHHRITPHFCNHICGLVRCTRCSLVGFKLAFFSRCQSQLLVYY